MMELVELEWTLPFPATSRQITLRVDGDLLVVEIQKYRCDWCQRLFAPNRSDAQYCGSNCRATHDRKT